VTRRFDVKSDTPFCVLVRNFLRGFVESDLVPDSVDPKQSLVGVFVVVMTPTLWMSLRPIAASHRHYVVWRQAIAQGTTKQIYTEIEVAYWGIELLFALYVMAVIAIVTFLVWDRLFPDPRDLMVLGTLPLSDHMLLGAKLAALSSFVGGFALALSAPSALGMAAGARNSPVSWMPLRYLCAHLIVMPATGLFVFLSLTALQTALSRLLRKRLLRGLSLVFQLFCVEEDLLDVIRRVLGQSGNFQYLHREEPEARYRRAPSVVHLSSPFRGARPWALSVVDVNSPHSPRTGQSTPSVPSGPP